MQKKSYKIFSSHLSMADKSSNWRRTNSDVQNPGKQKYNITPNNWIRAVSFNQINQIKSFLNTAPEKHLHSYLTYKPNNISAIALAIENGHTELALLLIEKSTITQLYEVNSESMNALHVAAHQGTEKVCLELIKKGIDVNALDRQLSTPLHIAAANCNLNIIKILIEHSADPLITNRDLESILHYLLINHHPNQLECLKYLVEELKIDINMASINGTTALHLATLNGDLEIVKYLINQGAELTTTSIKGNHLLHLAASKNHTHIIKYLIEKLKIDVNIENNDGESALIPAICNGIGIESLAYLIGKGINFDKEEILLTTNSDIVKHTPHYNLLLAACIADNIADNKFNYNLQNLDLNYITCNMFLDRFKTNLDLKGLPCKDYLVNFRTNLMHAYIPPNIAQLMISYAHDIKTSSKCSTEELLDNFNNITLGTQDSLEQQMAQQCLGGELLMEIDAYL